MRPMLVLVPVTVPTRPAPRHVPALPRRRCDSAEFSLGGDAYVVVPGLHAAAPPGVGQRVAEWSRRVRRRLGEAGFRAFAAVTLASCGWLCERGGS